MAVQLIPEPGGAAPEGADRCPYSRAFNAEFAANPACPAYQAASFTVLDTANRPLRSAVTCRHLTVGSDGRRRGRFYPRCGLGDAADRLGWVAAVTPGRVAVMRSLEEEFDDFARDDRARLIDAKARLLDGVADDGAAMDALEVELSAFLDRVDRFIDERGDRLADIGLDGTELRLLLSEWSLGWLRSQHVFGPALDVRPPGLGPRAAAFLGAGQVAGSARTSHADEVVTLAGRLVIEPTEAPRGLRLRGEIDAGNSDAIATAVSGALAQGGDVAVDFSGVLFCDLSGLRALVRAATSATDGGRVVVTGLPSHLQRAIGIVGWSELPALVIAESAPPAPRLEQPG